MASPMNRDHAFFVKDSEERAAAAARVYGYKTNVSPAITVSDADDEGDGEDNFDGVNESDSWDDAEGEL